MFDIDEHQGERFLTMEFVQGSSLTQLIGYPGRPLAMPVFLDVTQQICAGLAAAHAASVIHRDLKPDNVLIAKDGRVVLTDFGIARALQPSEVATPATGEFVGTPEYMSPEQAEGGAIDFRTDIYSLGIMLFEMLTGELPFVGATPLITAAARLIKPPPDPRSRQPTLSEPLAALVLRCLARKPQERFASVSELAESLSAVTGGLQAGAADSTASAAAGVAARGPQAAISVQNELPASGPSTASGGFLVTLDQGQGQGAHAAGKSVAVLPFRNQGPPSDAYLADGITDDLVDSLSMIAGLRMRSAGVVRQHLAKGDPAAIGKALDVDVLVEGSVRRMDELLRISARLIQVADGVQVWAQRFDRPAAHALQISDEVAQAVANALAVAASGPQRAVLQDAQAVDLYLRARALLQQGDRGKLPECISCFEQALVLRPSDAQLLSGYALALARQWFFGGVSDLGERARSAAERAVAAAPDRAESHLALASVRFSNSDGAYAVTELVQALKRSPNLVEAHDMLGRILIETGPVSRGLRHLEQAYDLEPRLARTFIDRARVQSLLGDWEAAERFFAQAEEAGAPIVPVLATRSRSILWHQNRESADAMLRRPDVASGKYPYIERMLEVAVGSRRADISDMVRGAFGSDSSSPRGQMFYHQLLTEFHCCNGDADQAVRSLARAVDLGFFDIIWYDRCPLLSILRRDLRYQALRRVVFARAARAQDALRG